MIGICNTNSLVLTSNGTMFRYNFFPFFVDKIIVTLFFLLFIDEIIINRLYSWGNNGQSNFASLFFLQSLNLVFFFYFQNEKMEIIQDRVLFHFNTQLVVFLILFIYLLKQKKASSVWETTRKGLFQLQFHRQVYWKE